MRTTYEWFGWRILIVAWVLCPLGVCAADAATDRMTLLYKKESADSPDRRDAVVSDATAALEAALLDRGYKVMKPPPEVIAALDRSPMSIVSFATDAGVSMLFAIEQRLRSDPGVDTVVADLTIRAKVFVGTSLLAVKKGRGEIRMRGTENQRRANQRHAMEMAAEEAAVDLVDLVDAALRALGPDQLAELMALGVVEETQIVDVPLPPPTPGASPLNPPAAIHALLVGVSDYSNVARINRQPVRSLAGVKTDLAQVRSALLGVGVETGNIAVLSDEDATAARVKSNLAGIARRAGPDDMIVVYISGHGIQADLKRAGMAMPVFFDFLFAEAESAPDFEQLLEIASNSAAGKIVMIIDTCHSGGAASVLPTVVISSRGLHLAKRSGAQAPQLLTRALDTSRAVAVLASAKYDEIAIDLGEGQGGLFTKHLVKGLREGKGTKVLRDVVSELVAAPVIGESKAICARSRNTCLDGQEQQTPTLGFSGSGDMISM